MLTETQMLRSHSSEPCRSTSLTWFYPEALRLPHASLSSSSCFFTRRILARVTSRSSKSHILQTLPNMFWLPFRILRISLIIPFWSIFSFLSICFPTAQVYLHPWLEFVQSICLGTFFLLLCEFVSPSEQHRDVFFAALTIKDKKSETGTQDGLQWFRVRWLDDDLCIFSQG